jgi:hypothetical protein
MQIMKEYRIGEFSISRSDNAPFRIELDRTSWDVKEKSSLSLDRATCKRYKIPLTLDLVGRTMICSFESKELPLLEGEWKGHVDYLSVRNDDLQIQSIEKKEAIRPMFNRIPPSKSNTAVCIMKLSSFGGGDGMHFHILPCPFYEITLELTEDEYEACRALSPTAVFRIHFALKD